MDKDCLQNGYFLQGWSEPWCSWRLRDKLILLLLICARKMFQLPAFMGKILDCTIIYCLHAATHTMALTPIDSILLYVTTELG